LNALARLVRHLQTKCVHSVVIEAGHIYVTERPTAAHLAACRAGAKLRDDLSAAGIAVRTMLYVDDYSNRPDGWTLDLKSYVEEITAVGFAPDVIVTESLVAALAVDVVERLRRRGRLLWKGGALYVNGDSVRVVGKRAPLSCELCEAALFELKQRMAEWSVTVLPASYREQQKRARGVFAALGHSVLASACIYMDGEDLSLSIPHGYHPARAGQDAE
jgi:hypothetical protein